MGKWYESDNPDRVGASLLLRAAAVVAVDGAETIVSWVI